MRNINIQFKSYFFRVTCFIFWLVICPRISGQSNQKKILTADEYKLWSSLTPDKISPKGNWVSYRLKYDYLETDTLFLQSRADLKRIAFPTGREGKFNNELDFGCISKGVFSLLNLKTQKLLEREGALNFKFSKNQKFVVILYKSLNEKLSLEVIDRTGGTLFMATNITNYCFDPQNNGIVYSTEENDKYGIELILFKDTIIKKHIAKNFTSPYQNLIWKTESFAFIENNNAAPSIYSFDFKKDKLNRLEPEATLGFSSQMKISNSLYHIPIPSNDGSQLFFWLKETKSDALQDNPDNVQIWNSKDKQLTDFKKLMPYYKLSDKLAVWNIKNNTVIQITDKELPKGFLSADYRNAFIYDPVAYEPQTNQNCPFDLYVMDLKNGKKELVIENYLYDERPQRSPDGKYLCYAKDKHWWIYDLQLKKHTGLTQEISTSFFSEDRDRPGEDAPYGIAGWSNTDEIVLYDRYDIWSISLDGKTKKRLTRGREIQKTYRVKSFDFNTYYDDVPSRKKTLDSSIGFLIMESDKETGQTGLGWWKRKNGFHEYMWKKRKISHVSKAENSEVYMYLDQNYENAPRLMVFDGKEKEIFKSNKQQSRYFWGKNERIDYQVDRTKTKGVLYYPAGFIKGKKYPLVVHIYERQFSYFNDYINPSLLSGDGFNITNFVNNGYFVLLPDIIYEEGNLSKSVTKSVLSAVDAAVAKGDVEGTKVGLIGHSFGGYETDLVITQTNRFAAAVAGAAISDLVSMYLYVGPAFIRPDFFRTENHQFRIGKSLYEDMNAYLKNSPVLLAADIKTPLLGWAGEDDKHVHSFQTIEFYLALRRLNKEHTLLMYPEEQHELIKKKNQIDLSTRIMKWFDYYLKNGVKEPWMSSDFNR